ncbi:MAG: hypothetical protein GXY19_16640 [Phycisphaerae bacterium]|nr:hypothetical protein [Phycisphaerae bacterium]
MFTDRMYRLARHWSNRELATLAPLFHGDVVNVSAWDDRDKEGGYYKDYFTNASSYSYTNYRGYRGFQGLPGEYTLDLTDKVPGELKCRFDVVFNHTTLEHLFEVRKAFANLCELSRDVIIVIVPFAQVQHESDDWKDYWRFTPTCLRRLCDENGLTVIYEAQSPHRNSAVYLLAIGARCPDRWEGRLPMHEPVPMAGRWIGITLFSLARQAVLSGLKKVCSDEDAKK